MCFQCVGDVFWKCFQCVGFGSKLSHTFSAEKQMLSKNGRTDWKPCLLCCFPLNTCKKVTGRKKVECRFQRAMLWLLWYIIIVHSEIFWSHLKIPRAVIDDLWNLLPQKKHVSSKQMQTAPTTRLQAILQMVHDPNKPGTGENSIKWTKTNW